MKKFFNVTSHVLTEEQRVAAADKYSSAEFVELPANLKTLWGNVPPEVDVRGVAEHLAPLLNWLLHNCEEGDVVLAAGEYTAVAITAAVIAEVGGKTVQATTKRESVEVASEDGSVVKQSVFRHVAFRDVFPAGTYLDEADHVDSIWVGTAWE